MSIDAVIVGFTAVEGLDAVLTLEARGDGVAGQNVLEIQNTPVAVEALGILIGCEVWGNSSMLMLGDQHIANRLSYTRIELLPNWASIARMWHDQRSGKAGA